MISLLVSGRWPLIQSTMRRCLFPKSSLPSSSTANRMHFPSGNHTGDVDAVSGWSSPGRSQVNLVVEIWYACDLISDRRKTTAPAAVGQSVKANRYISRRTSYWLVGNNKSCDRRTGVVSQRFALRSCRQCNTAGNGADSTRPALAMPVWRGRMRCYCIRKRWQRSASVPDFADDGEPGAESWPTRLEEDLVAHGSGR